MVTQKSLLVVSLMVALSLGLLAVNLFGKKGVTDLETKEISISAKRFAFTPDTIIVKKGETVRLRISSEDVTHGFSIFELGVNQVIEPGKETIVELTPAREGKYRFFCSVECGNGHPAMQGYLIVE